MALNFDECRRKWLRLEQDLGSCQEVLAKTQTERGSLEVKLKHARNQVDVEIRRRQKAEAECEKLVRRSDVISLICTKALFKCFFRQLFYPDMLMGRHLSQEVERVDW